MREVFSDFSLISRYVEVEIALARAEARCGVIPAEAARGNRRTHRRLRRSISTCCATRPISSAIRSCRWCTRWSKQCGEAGRYVHWGATTQDIMDTAVVLQMRDGLDDDRSRYRRLARHPRRSVAALPRYADGGPHPSAAGAAGDVRLQGRDLARDVRPPRRAPRTVEAARAGRPVRRRRRHAGLARRQAASKCSRRCARSSASACPSPPGTSRATASPRP